MPSQGAQHHRDVRKVSKFCSATVAFASEKFLCLQLAKGDTGRKLLLSLPDSQADMLQKRAMIEGKPWSVDAVEGGRELFEFMCIDASRFTKDGNMQPGPRCSKGSTCRDAGLKSVRSLRLCAAQALGAKGWLCPD